MMERFRTNILWFRTMTMVLIVASLIAASLVWAVMNHPSLSNAMKALVLAAVLAVLYTLATAAFGGVYVANGRVVIVNLVRIHRFPSADVDFVRLESPPFFGAFGGRIAYMYLKNGRRILALSILAREGPFGEGSRREAAEVVRKLNSRLSSEIQPPQVS